MPCEAISKGLVSHTFEGPIVICIICNGRRCDCGRCYCRSAPDDALVVETEGDH